MQLFYPEEWVPMHYAPPIDPNPQLGVKSMVFGDAENISGVKR